MKDKNLEKYVLSVFLFHHIAMFIGAINNDWSIWIPIVIMITGVTSLFVVFSNMWEFSTRSLFATIMVNSSIVLYGSQSDTVLDIMVPFLGITVVMGLYGLQKLMIIPFVAITFLIFYHRIAIHSFEINGADDIYKYAMPFLNVYFIIFILYFWNMKRNESAKHMGRIISELKIAERGKDDFLANVSHEIRTPVNTVVGMSEVILREELDEKIKDNVLSIQTSGRQLVSIVSDILDFSELQSGKMKLVEVEYNINSTIQDIISMSQAMSIDKDIDIIVNCDGSIPITLIGDEQKLRRMILNLMNNAIKFTNEGCVILNFEYRPEEYGINLVITVSDTGIGIDKRNLERLFTTYNQVDTKRNRQEGGIGLGLAIVKAIVENMGGVISVKSELGKGTEFKIVVPQKVKGEERLVKPSSAGKYRFLTFFNLEQFDQIKIRDAYTKQIKKIANDLNVQLHMCHNIAELKRRIERDSASTIIISIFELLNDEEYFYELAKKQKVVTIIDSKDEKLVTSPNIIKLCKPIFIGTFLDEIENREITRHEKFTAPDAEILIVDDNMINLKVISGVLAPYNMKITLSTSGADALEKLDKNQYDLIFMDHMMPEMDGIEALQRIRNKSGLYYKEVPIVALTANAVAGAREMFLEEGFQEFVAKPVELGILERVLKTFISPSKILYNDLNDDTSVSEGVINNTSENEKADVHLDNSDLETSSSQGSISGLEDFDLEQGITFCGSMDNLIDILHIHFNDGDENYNNIQKFYEAKDWKNYSILVHGLKSSMKSVGANVLSEKARLLESASKSLDEDYIINNHEEMMQEYKRIITNLGLYFGEEPEEKEDLSELIDLSEEDFSGFILDFENATYSWDDSLIRKMIEKLNGHCYKGNSMNEIIDTISNKIEMTDYISAFETIKKWKEKIDRKA